MTPKRPTTSKRFMQTVLPLAGLGIVAAALSGCGGASTTNNPIIATPDSGPVLYGINALATSSGAVTAGETSGMTFTPTGGSPQGVIVGAFAYNTVSGAGPLPTYKSSFPNTSSSTAGVPLGFSPSGGSFYYNVSASVAALPTNYTGSLIFGVYASQGAKGGFLVPINPSSIILTSPEAPSFSLPLVFDPNVGTGVLAQTEYKTAPFAIPSFLQTTGLHDMRATIADTDSQSSTTDFAVATVAPTDVALFLQSLTVSTAATATAAATTTTTAITPGDTVTIDGGKGIGFYPAGYTPTIADAQGTVVLFTTPGTHTLTESDSTGKVVQTETFTLDPTTAGTTILMPPTPDGTPTGSIRVVHPAAKRAIKRG